MKTNSGGRSSLEKRGETTVQLGTFADFHPHGNSRIIDRSLGAFLLRMTTIFFPPVPRPAFLILQTLVIINVVFTENECGSARWFILCVDLHCCMRSTLVTLLNSLSYSIRADPDSPPKI
jgi:hypothetical protein